MDELIDEMKRKQLSFKTSKYVEVQLNTDEGIGNYEIGKNSIIYVPKKASGNVNIVGQKSDE